MKPQDDQASRSDADRVERMQQELREREEALMRVHRVGGVVPVDVDVAGGLHARHSAEYVLLHGLTEDQRSESHGQWLSRIHPDDRVRVEQTLQEALAGKAAYECEYRIVRPSDGAVRWICAKADIERDRHGHATRMIGAHIDVTDLKNTQQILRESEARLGFLLAFSDLLRRLADPHEIEQHACKALRAHLGASAVTWSRMFDEGEIEVTALDQDARASSMAGRYRLQDYGYDVEKELRAGRVSWRDDVRQDCEYTDSQKEALMALRCIAWANAPLIRGDSMVAMLTVHFAEPHAWTQSELDLIAEIAERTWNAAERARAEAALSRSERRFRALTSASSEVLFRVNADWSEMCQLSGGGFLRDTDSPDRDWLGKYILVDDRARFLERIRDAVERMDTFEMEHRVQRADGSIGWAYSRAVPILDDVGRIAEWFGAAADITARKQAEEGLRRFGEASSDLLWMRSADTLQWLYLSPAFETIYGERRDQAMRGDNFRNWVDLIVPEDRPHALANIERVRAGEQVCFEYRILRPSDGEIRWLRNSDFPIADASGKVQCIAGVGHDATEEKTNATRMQVMVAELQHRTRNLIAVVRAIAKQTMAITGPTAAFQEQFGDRLAALARVQGLLSRSDEEPILLDSLIRMELDAVGADPAARSRIRLAGPAVTMRHRVVQTMALALHELATNARKHGALSNGSGHLRVSWVVVTSNEHDPRLILDWVEDGVDAAHVAALEDRAGYGRELIEKALPYSLAARTQFELGRSGVHCRIDLPLNTAARTGSTA